MAKAISAATTMHATAVLAGAFLSGAMVSHGITIPIYLDTNTDAEHMVKQWARLYHYGHMLMPALCVLTTSTYAYLATTTEARRRLLSRNYAIAALTTVAMIPFTLIFMMSTNAVLFGLEEDSATATMPQVRSLLVRWAQLHLVRSCFPLLGAIIGLQILWRVYIC